ncbi:mucin-17-like [Macrobrachium rosenbergii]|uniref:mucin-17-like n=1 Tax=Macrobrachium rosenbergii TaxID=79674 RepID=UPI0034D6D7BB
MTQERSSFRSDVNALLQVTLLMVTCFEHLRGIVVITPAPIRLFNDTAEENCSDSLTGLPRVSVAPASINYTGKFPRQWVNKTSGTLPTTTAAIGLDISGELSTERGPVFTGELDFPKRTRQTQTSSTSQQDPVTTTSKNPDDSSVDETRTLSSTLMPFTPTLSDFSFTLTLPERGLNRITTTPYPLKIPTFTSSGRELNTITTTTYPFKTLTFTSSELDLNKITTTPNPVETPKMSEPKTYVLNLKPLSSHPKDTSYKPLVAPQTFTIKSTFPVKRHTSSVTLVDSTDTVSLKKPLELNNKIKGTSSKDVLENSITPEYSPKNSVSSSKYSALPSKLNLLPSDKKPSVHDKYTESPDIATVKEIKGNYSSKNSTGNVTDTPHELTSLITTSFFGLISHVTAAFVPPHLPGTTEEPFYKSTNANVLAPKNSTLSESTHLNLSVATNSNMSEPTHSNLPKTSEPTQANLSEPTYSNLPEESSAHSGPSDQLIAPSFVNIKKAGPVDPRSLEKELDSALASRLPLALDPDLLYLWRAPYLQRLKHTNHEMVDVILQSDVRTPPGSAECPLEYQKVVLLNLQRMLGLLLLSLPQSLKEVEEIIWDPDLENYLFRPQGKVILDVTTCKGSCYTMDSLGICREIFYCKDGATPGIAPRLTPEQLQKLLAAASG